MVLALRSALGREANLCAFEPGAQLAFSETVRATFARLATEALDHGLVLFGPGSPFVIEDELAILSRLAQFQRPAVSMRWKCANPLQASLKECAFVLIAAGWRLPVRPPLKPAYVMGRDCFRIVWEDPREIGLAQPNNDPVAKPGSQEQPEAAPGTLKARAVELARGDEPVAAAMFRQHGISAQFLQRLCLAGILEKVGRGYYRRRY
ncbi:type IV toxin-antitoxin system AbiEi family antitoxin domain-containing protein [Novosphingobium sp. PhB165]|uniref:type IV toxin-antitoxin system AbiEi family antitoxin domain-containing protein n=1 Tax=Novosphingobium sp. PhB165 TaxID=2485105 RepID=UPI001404CECA|nr:type IV toxin-antitoxin system AbiEi family antitoxin domain-containing protein [Novosphingobium sp. PhB165]